MGLIEQIVFVLFCLVFVGLAYHHRHSSLYEYTLDRQQTTLFRLVCTILASIIGGGFIIAIITLSFKGGMIGVLIGASYTIGFFLIGLISPTIKEQADRHGYVSFHDFITHTHGQFCSVLVQIVNLAVFFFFVAAQFVAFASILDAVYGGRFYVTLIVGSFLVVVYTAVSGLKGVFLTDIFQICVLGAIMFFVVAPALWTSSDGLHQLGSLPPEYFSGLGMGPVFAIGALIVGGLTFLVRIDLWQRVFAAENAQTAKRAFFIAGVFIAPFFLLYTLLGMDAKVQYPDLKEQQIVPALLHGYFSNRYILLAVVCAVVVAIISSTDSLLNVLAVNLVKDRKSYGKTWKKLANDGYADPAVDQFLKSRVRICTCILGAISLFVAIAFPDIVTLIIGATSGLLIILPTVLGGLLLTAPKPLAGQVSVVAGALVLITLFPMLPTMAFVPALIISSLAYVAVACLGAQPQKTAKDAK